MTVAIPIRDGKLFLRDGKLSGQASVKCHSLQERIIDGGGLWSVDVRNLRFEERKNVWLRKRLWGFMWAKERGWEG